MLEVSGLVSGHGGVPVLRETSVTVEAGQILLVLGANGVGKSTFLSTVAGLLPARSGSIRLGGTDMTRMSAATRVRHGVRLVMDGQRVFPHLSVMDNLLIGGVPLSSRRLAEKRALECFEVFPVLADRRRSPAHLLSGGQRQMLALAQAFMVRPRLLMCDEPSLGLASSLLPQVWDFIVARADEGAAVIIVEQLMHPVLARAHRAAVMDRGAFTRQGAAADVLASPELADIYLGTATSGREPTS